MAVMFQRGKVGMEGYKCMFLFSSSPNPFQQERAQVNSIAAKAPSKKINKLA